MKDFVSGREIDIQGLMKVHQAGEVGQAKGKLMMSAWRSYCGTAACLIGSFCDQNQYDPLRIQDSDMSFIPVIVCANEIFEQDSAVAKRFGLTGSEVGFLFTDHSERLPTAQAWTASELPGPQALARLRKFLYYKMRKAELLEDYESARKSSGIDVSQAASKAPELCDIKGG